MKFLSTLQSFYRYGHKAGGELKSADKAIKKVFSLLRSNPTESVRFGRYKIPFNGMLVENIQDELETISTLKFASKAWNATYQGIKNKIDCGKRLSRTQLDILIGQNLTKVADDFQFGYGVRSSRDRDLLSRQEYEMRRSLEENKLLEESEILEEYTSDQEEADNNNAYHNIYHVYDVGGDEYDNNTAVAAVCGEYNKLWEVVSSPGAHKESVWKVVVSSPNNYEESILQEGGMEAFQDDTTMIFAIDRGVSSKESAWKEGMMDTVFQDDTTYEEIPMISNLKGGSMFSSRISSNSFRVYNNDNLERSSLRSTQNQSR